MSGEYGGERQPFERTGSSDRYMVAQTMDRVPREQ